MPAIYDETAIIINPPGTRHRDCSRVTTLGEVLHNATAELLQEHAQRRLFTALGIEKPKRQSSPLRLA